MYIERIEDPSGLAKPAEVSCQGGSRVNVREHSGNIQGTFREHSGIIQATLRDYDMDVCGPAAEVTEHFLYLKEASARSRTPFHGGPPPNI